MYAEVDRFGGFPLACIVPKAGFRLVMEDHCRILGGNESGPRKVSSYLPVRQVDEAVSRPLLPAPFYELPLCLSPVPITSMCLFILPHISCLLVFCTVPYVLLLLHFPSACQTLKQSVPPGATLSYLRCVRRETVKNLPTTTLSSAESGLKPGCKAHQ
ncbi:unnamed protein product [Arctogadus glacialis]